MNNKSDSTGLSESNTIRSDLSKSFGAHFIIELINCPPHRLAKVPDTKKIMIEVVKKSRSKMVGSCFHQFEPQGASGVILIQESHFSVHTWPEEGYAAADIFTCGEEMDPYIAIDALKEMFGAEEVRYQKITRGF